MHLDSLTGKPEREANRRETPNAVPHEYFAKHQHDYGVLKKNYKK